MGAIPLGQREHPPAPAPPRARLRTPTAVVLAAIVLGGAALRGLYLLELAGSPELTAPALDAAFHDHWARALLGGDWTPPATFADPRIQETPYFRPPAYPWFLAALYGLTGHSPLGARALQMLLGLGNVVLGFLLGRALAGPAVGLWTAAWLSCYWSLPYFEGELLAPVLLVALMLGTALACHRFWHRGGWPASLCIGLLLGLFALARPNALLLAPVVWLWALRVARRERPRRRTLAAALGLPLGLALAIAPATIRNLAVAGDPVLITSNGGINLYIGNNEQADGHSARLPILSDLVPQAGWTCFEQTAIARGVERLEGRPLRASEVSAFFARRARDFVFAQPDEALRLTARKACLFWGPAEVSNNRELEIARAHSPVLRWLPRFPWLLSLALVGLALLAREPRRPPPDHRRDLALLLAALVLAWFASHLPFFVAGRYRVPIVPLLAVFAAFAADRLLALYRARQWRRAAAWSAVWLALLAGAHVPLVGYRPDQANWHLQRGEAFRRNGDLDRALAELQLAVATGARTEPLPHHNLGALLLQLDRPAEAIPHLREAIRLQPRYLEAHANLALAWANTGRDDLACNELEEVLRLDPDHRAARTRLGGLLLRRGMAQQALPHLERASREAPADDDARYLFGVALIDAGRRADGRAVLGGLAVGAPRHADALVVLAELLAEDGDRDGAARLLERALAARPGHAGAAALLRRLR